MYNPSYAYREAGALRLGDLSTPRSRGTAYFAHPHALLDQHVVDRPRSRRVGVEEERAIHNPHLHYPPADLLGYSQGLCSYQQDLASLDVHRPTPPRTPGGSFVLLGSCRGAPYLVVITLRAEVSRCHGSRVLSWSGSCVLLGPSAIVGSSLMASQPH
jgi:hypothetical protein